MVYLLRSKLATIWEHSAHTLTQQRTYFWVLQIKQQLMCQ